MSCDSFRNSIVGLLYDDIGETDRAEVLAHLAACPACRERRAGLEATREHLRQGASEVPRAPRVVVVGRSAPRARTWLGFAAGIAVALLAAGGAAAGYAYGTGRATPATSAPAPAELVQQEVDRRWKELEAALAAARREPEAAPSTITRDDLEAAMLRLERKIDGSRASDLDYMQNLLDASERRTGSWIGETQKALRYVALANDPALSER